MCSCEYSKLYTSTTCNITSSYSEHTECVLDLQPRNSSIVEEKARLIRSILMHMPVMENNNNDSLNTQIPSKQLISLCDKNEDDIILMGNTMAFLSLSDVTYKIIEEIIDKNISENINIWISKLMEKRNED
ncbi:hypothetical protein ALC53_00399 [Atta colombica]|uniref:Uncharacterized protein n=1 Tax=Atta colombica TaxID=520822 RepID=A0A195BY46_9HYME|nr:hypothetical protein ALC53_00399 [Atta colombica]